MMRQYDKQKIARILSKFMAGETSLDEEQLLAEYFRTHEVGNEWQEYKEMFALFDSGAVDIEQEAKPTARPKVVPFRWIMTGIAASIMLLIGLSLLMKEGKTNEVLPEIAQQTSQQSTSQPTPLPVIEEKKEETVMAVMQATPQPVKKRRKAVKKQSIPIEEPAQTETEQPIHERDIGPMYAQTEEKVTPYHTMQTIHLPSDVAVYVIEASDVPDVSMMPSVSELRARGLRLKNYVRQASQTTVQF